MTDFGVEKPPAASDGQSGAVYAASGAAMPHSFTGKPYDGASGLHYFPYRYYGADVMRWITRDPMEMVDGPNVYLYVAASPVNAVDPTGQFKLPWLETTGDCGKPAPCADEVFGALGIGGSNGNPLPQGYFIGRSMAVDFRPCCCKHDGCDQYLKCDLDFFLCMAGNCSARLHLFSRDHIRCIAQARVYFTAVRAFNILQGRLSWVEPS